MLMKKKIKKNTHTPTYTHMKITKIKEFVVKIANKCKIQYQILKKQT